VEPQARAIVTRMPMPPVRMTRLSQRARAHSIAFSRGVWTEGSGGQSQAGAQVARKKRCQEALLQGLEAGAGPNETVENPHRGHMFSAGFSSETTQSWQERHTCHPFLSVFSCLHVLCSWRSDGQISTLRLGANGHDPSFLRETAHTRDLRMRPPSACATP
jgi:hypothetical protein